MSSPSHAARGLGNWTMYQGLTRFSRPDLAAFWRSSPTRRPVRAYALVELNQGEGAHAQSVRSDRAVYCPNQPSPTASTMTSQGSAHGRFRRAIHRRQLFAAEMAARELEGLSLIDALDLTLLIREADRRRYERAAVRWLERFIQERRPTLMDLALAATALAQLDGVGDQSLRDLLRHRPRDSARVLTRPRSE